MDDVYTKIPILLYFARLLKRNRRLKNNCLIISIIVTLFRVFTLNKTLFIKTLFINPATETDFERIVPLIHQFELDDRELKKEQFLVAKQDNELIGFGRIRARENCSELCSLGVIETNRLQGIGKDLVRALINTSHQPLYLVCIIPVFFERFGFKVVSRYPKEMQEKLDYCSSELAVPEAYVVMKYVNFTI
jgi:N-acetylglutamate synthase-like GNAT family acetyltransferase